MRPHCGVISSSPLGRTNVLSAQTTAEPSRTQHGKPSRTTALLAFYGRKNSPRLPELCPTCQRAKHPTRMSQAASDRAVAQTCPPIGRGDLLRAALYPACPVRSARPASFARSACLPGRQDRVRSASVLRCPASVLRPT